MEVNGFWSLMRRYTALVVVGVVVGGAVGFFLQSRDANGYVATARLYANNKQASNTAANSSTSLAVQRMDSYVKLVNSSRMAERLVSRLSLPTSPRALAGAISASLDKDTVIMTVSVVADTAGEASAIADVLPGEFTAFVNQLSDTSVSDPTATTFSIVDGPTVAPNSSRSRLALSMLLGVILGGAVAMAVASVLVRRRSGRTPEAAVALTGVPVVGVVPRASRRDGAVSGDVLEDRRLAHHRLARNLTHLTKPQHRVVVVCSTTGRPSSAETSAGLATALAHRGQKVLYVDASFDATPLPASWGVGASPDASPSTVLGTRSLTEAATLTEVPNLSVVSLGEQYRAVADADAGRRLPHLLQTAAAQYDTVVVDAVPVLSPADVPTGVEDADAVLLVIDQFETTPDETSSVVDGLKAMTSASLGLVVENAGRRTMTPSQFEVGLVLPRTTTLEDSLATPGLR